MIAKIKKKFGKRHRDWDKRDLIFYIALMAFPVLQFVIFYIVVNINSLALAFQKYDVLTNETIFVGFSNFKEAFRLLTQTDEMLSAAKYSLLTYLVGLVVGIPLAILFSYYIYKKMFGHKFFRVLLFMPSIISAIIMVTIYQFFVERALPDFLSDLFHIERINGLIENPSTRFFAIVLYNVWMSFGVNVLMYSDAMGSIPPELSEAARLDGATGFKEFWYITLPMIFPTLSTFLVVGVAGFFINQFNLYSFFGTNSTIKTYGYWLYVQTQLATSKAEYPIIAAVGILLTFIAVPVTLLVKRLLEKFGPSEE